ncbi:MAG: hypothetical protein ACOVQG_00615 [Crocinitomicaceae bacterium]|jgi:hypothetical protein
MVNQNLENNNGKDKLSGFSDYVDYKASLSVNKFFTLKGFIEGLLIALIIVPFALLITMIILIYLAVFMTFIPSLILTCAGIGMYYYDRSLKKKTSLLINESYDCIKLSSPLNVDIVSFFSGLLFFVGIILVLFSLSSSLTFYFGGVSSFLFTIYFYKLYKKFRHSLFDKIEIFKDYILIDRYESKQSIRINKNEISKLVDLRLIASNSLDKRIIEFHFLNKSGTETIEIEDEHLENMRLNIDLFIDSLKKFHYEISNESFTFGQDYRTDENGNQILN